MNRRRSILAIGAALAARGLPARAQSGAVRVGFLSGGTETDTPAYLASFREGLAALGYREGDNLTLDVVCRAGRIIGAALSAEDQR